MNKILMESSESDVPGPSETKSKGIKRRRNTDSWERNVAKRNRNSGKSYVSISTGKQVAAKKVQFITSCCKKK